MKAGRAEPDMPQRQGGTWRRRIAGLLKPSGSLRHQLLAWLLGPLLLLVAVDAVFVYRNALSAADLAYDRSLLASTRALAERVTLIAGKTRIEVPHAALYTFESDSLGRLYYRVSGVQGEFVAGYANLPPVPEEARHSLAYPALVYFYDADYRGENLRIAALEQPVYDDNGSGIALIQVGESREARRALSRQILFDTLWRQAALVFAAGLLVWAAVRVVLQPLQRLERELGTREPTDLRELDTRLVHRELRPMLAAMNGYMGRLQTLISGQRRFIADASHQLRTPLTVLKTQAELALRETDPQVVRMMLAGIVRTTDATVHLANGLLTLARARYGAAESEFAPLCLRAQAREVAVKFAPRAVERGLDLAFEGELPVPVTGNALLLQELIANLIDNAICYTPAGGRIVVRTALAAEGEVEQRPRLEVEDSGPGIPLAERERVFAPFYRAAASQAVNPAGSGLGLSIVRDIAAIHGASIRLDSGAAGQGLCVQVRFPPLAAPAQ